MHWTATHESLPSGISMGLSGAQADVAVGIAAGIVGIDVEHASVAGIVPVATTIRQTR